MNDPADNTSPNQKSSLVKKTTVQLNPQFEEVVNWTVLTWNCCLLRYYRSSLTDSQLCNIIVNTQCPFKKDTGRQLGINIPQRLAISKLSLAYPYLPGTN
ncbi:hypothetical protein KTO58_19980 [Chitinophaga pendula]|uniref:hypothetical protein n=1 Tax=Chitinophaga TaxID=79328 RepID=UPI000BAF7F6D|nr:MULTISPECIES: hypothetical protein [Chitinophaga]ASZ11054.1 hypothetical protein CK934_08815 [Chitinophaga sp. MD30]UCJ05949.1 hypothetical protein KTO58_19980 [Chitinophaga pendula]